jgi:hypothetical protein
MRACACTGPGRDFCASTNASLARQRGGGRHEGDFREVQTCQPIAKHPVRTRIDIVAARAWPSCTRPETCAACNRQQVERIAAPPQGTKPSPAARVLLPALATLGLVLVAGAAFAVAKGGLRSLPVVGPLFAPASPSELRINARQKHRRPATPKPALDHLWRLRLRIVSPGRARCSARP